MQWHELPMEAALTKLYRVHDRIYNINERGKKTSP